MNDKESNVESLGKFIRDMGKSILIEAEDVKGVEFTVFMKNGVRIYYNSREDLEN